MRETLPWNEVLEDLGKNYREKGVVGVWSMARELRALWRLQWRRRADRRGSPLGHWPEIIGIWCLEGLLAASIPKNESRSPQENGRGKSLSGRRQPSSHFSRRGGSMVRGIKKKEPHSTETNG